MAELQNTTRGFPIFADDATSIGTGLAGLTITATLSKNGGSFVSAAPTITDLGNGHYWVVPLAAHRDTLGWNQWRFVASGAVIAPVFEKIRAVDEQDADWGMDLDALATQSTANLIKQVTDKLDAMIEDVGGERFTDHALGEAPGGGGAGGGLDHPLEANC